MPRGKKKKKTDFGIEEPRTLAQACQQIVFLEMKNRILLDHLLGETSFFDKKPQEDGSVSVGVTYVPADSLEERVKALEIQVKTMDVHLIPLFADVQSLKTELMAHKRKKFPHVLGES